jgi:CRP-like cAMP-binding protein
MPARVIARVRSSVKRALSLRDDIRGTPDRRVAALPRHCRLDKGRHMSASLHLFGNERSVETYTTGQVLFEEGQPGTCLFVLRSGQLRVMVGGVTVETIEPGGMVGEMALLDDAPRSATVIAVVDSEVVAIDRKRFLFLVQQTPFFALDVMRVMADRLRAMNHLLGGVS